VATARDLGFPFTVVGGWVWEPDSPDLPFSWVEPLYYQRLRLKEEGRVGAQRELKFALNSLYGKLCQARGATRSRPPAFHNLAWAGWTTSHCRATLLEMMCRVPYDVVYVMTDSVASTRPVDLPVGKDIGQWELTIYDRAQVIQAGVVTLWRGGVCETEKYRGFDVGTLTAAAVDERWRLNFESGRPEPLRVLTRRPVNLGSALINEEWFEKWNSWQEVWRELDVYGGSGKRWRPWDVREKEPWRYLCEISAWEPLPAGDALEIYGGELPLSWPYEPKWAAADSRELQVVPGSWTAQRVAQDETEAALLRVRNV
jgi:hypothetical protein